MREKYPTVDSQTPEGKKWLAHFFAMGLPNTLISQATGLSEKRLKVLRASPLMQNLIDDAFKALQEHIAPKFLKPITERFNAAIDEALETITDLMAHAESESVKLSAAKEILDRAPEAPKVKKEMVEDRTIRFVFGEDERQTAHQVLQEAGFDARNGYKSLQALPAMIDEVERDDE